jgi:hypothetical protein
MSDDKQPLRVEYRDGKKISVLAEGKGWRRVIEEALPPRVRRSRWLEAAQNLRDKYF